MINYQKWLRFLKEDLSVDPRHLWFDSRMHLWWNKGVFDFVCGLRGVVYETVISGNFYRLHLYNQPKDNYKNHLLMIKDGKWEKIYMCNSFSEAQLYAHEVKLVD